MTKYVLKRLGISLLIMLLGSLLMFVLTINSGDPLFDLRESSSRNRDNLMKQRIEIMGLNKPWYVRYWDWISGVGRCFIGKCDLGLSRTGQSVNSILGSAMTSTLRLVFLSTILAAVFGIAMGIVTSIRQYSGIDYAITLVAFVFYSLPSFVFAVLLKEYAGIKFNAWLSEPIISLLPSLIVGVLVAIFVQGVVAGSARKRFTAAGISLVVVVALLQYVSLTDWFHHPISGWWMQLLAGLGAAVLFTSLFTGLGNRKVLCTSLASAVVVSLISLALTNLLWQPSWGMIVLIALAFAVIGGLIGYFFGGYARRSALWAGVWTSLTVVIAIIVDFLLRYWSYYLEIVGSRPISTIGSETPNFVAKDYFWLNLIDTSTHLFLPTISMTLVSFAAYTRYTRSAMLEVLGQDYVRTARAKGLPERVVITRHAFRNAMIPITTIIAFDFAGLVGGAVITESVFGWKGMGSMFTTGLNQVDPAPVMAFFLITGSAAVFMNLVADLLYAYIDPRIRR